MFEEREMFELWDYMVDTGIATDEEIGLTTAMCGRSLATLERVLYVRTGYRSLEQIREEEEEEDW